MSGDDEFLDQFDLGGRPPVNGEQWEFGKVMYPWRTPAPYDGPQSPAPRRPELLGDLEDAWWADVTSWTEWAIATFRLSRWFPQCWLRHSALVEEAQALWLLWCAAWLPGTDPHGPTHFLSNLSLALQRIETLWQIPCRADSHTEPAPPRPASRLRPVTAEWWSLPEFDPTLQSW